MFHFPAPPHHPIHSDDGDPPSREPGFPIRTPSDHSSADNSPRLIAVTHVLHRIPSAQASTVCPPKLHQHNRQAIRPQKSPDKQQDAHTHYPLLKHPQKHPHQRVPSQPDSGHSQHTHTRTLANTTKNKQRPTTPAHTLYADHTRRSLERR